LKPICKKFSSGHSIVLLIICRLIEELEEKTLVLLDEPESHLHPPLLSTFIRILSDLLVKRNGIGLIATHS
ncbi:AAA family ATPase, partial [Klebsiella pneumoniae]|uniref:AAA family ATPase n=2 Tax=Bacteria TaxID=2 RepID=UPI00273939F9